MALVVFLKGINVGGHRTFRPSALAKQLARFDVVNVGAAGTFVIRKPVGQAQIRTELTRRLPFDAEVMICKGDEIIALARSAPFKGYRARPDIIWFVSILARSRTLPSIPIQIPADGEWGVKVLACRGRCVLGFYRRQMKAISYLGQLEKMLGVPVTTRNWNTILAIAGILKST
jgi:uncharacterized protein (DUF1697 family)